MSVDATFPSTTRRAPVDLARDPDRWLARGAWLVVALSALQILLFGFGRDQGIYATVGRGVLEGLMPYRDLWDFKPPGIFLVYAVAELLFGASMASVRVLEVAGLLIIVIAFQRMAGELFGQQRIGLVGGALAALIHAQLEFWHTGQPETFGGVLTVLALMVTVRLRGLTLQEPARARARARGWVVVGALFGVAFLLKPPLGGGAVVCAAYLAGAEREASRSWKRAGLVVLVMGAASLIPILACAAWFAGRHAWDALRWTLFEFTPGYTALGWKGAPLGMFLYGAQESLIGFSAVVPVGIVAAFVLRPLHSSERQGLFLLLGVVALHIAGIAMQAKFFQYHYAATLPLLAFIAGLGLYKLWRRALAWRAVGVTAFALAVAGLVAVRVALRHNPGTFWERSALRMRFLLTRTPSREALDATLYHVVDYDLGADRKVARIVATLAPPEASVFVWGFEPVIYWLSNRRPASRFIYDVPQRVSWNRERPRVELLGDLARDPPAVFVVQHGDVFRHVTGNAYDSHQALGTFPALQSLLEERYALSESVAQFDVYVRR